MKKIFLILSVFISSALLGQDITKLSTIHKDFTVQQADSLIQANSGNPSFVIIDVRQQVYYDAGHIEGAIDIDYYAINFGALIDTLNKNKMYLVYCASGNRSTKACDTMIKKNFVEVYNMLGGTGAWTSAGYPLVITTGFSELNNSERTSFVYPNPITDISTIEFNGMPDAVNMINIYDMFGRKVKSISLNNNENKFTIDRQQFVSGTYLYYIISGNSVFISGKLEIE
jgi:phage shock protein E